MARLSDHIQRNLVGYLALVIALGGTSYAAVQLADNSVGTRHLKDGAVTTPKIENKAVGKAKIVPGVVPFSRSKLAPVDFGGSSLDPPASPDEPDRFKPLEFTMPFRGKATITAIIPWWWHDCHPGIFMRAGLYVDGNPVPGTYQNVPHNHENARGTAFVATLTLPRGPHRADIGVDCPEGEPSSGSFEDMVWNVTARK